MTVPVSDPVFIGGSASTGSTLLRVMLDRHPEICSGPELSVFNKQKFLREFDEDRSAFIRWLRKGLRTSGYSFYYKFFHHRKAYGISDDDLLKWSREAADVKAFMDRLIAHCLDYTQARVFVEKTPSNALSFPDLLELYPRARFVHVYRDGRDVVCSLRKRRFSWFQGTSSWLFNTAAALRLKGHPNYFQVSYRDLVTQPEEQLSALCDFIGVDFSASMLNSGEDRFEARKNLKKAWESSPVQSVKSTSLKRYRRELDEVGMFIFNHTALTKEGANRLGIQPMGTKETMRKLGYHMQSVSETPSGKLAAKCLQYSDWAYRTLKSLKHIEKPDPPLTRLECTLF